MTIMRFRMPNMGQVFERRGDPLVSPREGLSGYGRVVEIENVDHDAENQRLSSAYWDRKLKEELAKAQTVVAVVEDKPEDPRETAKRRIRNLQTVHNRKLNAMFKKGY